MQNTDGIDIGVLPGFSRIVKGAAVKTSRWHWVKILAAFACYSSALRLGEEGPDFLLEDTLDDGRSPGLTSHIDMHGSRLGGVFGSPWLMLRRINGRGQDNIWRASNGAVLETQESFGSQQYDQIDREVCSHASFLLGVLDFYGIGV